MSDNIKVVVKVRPLIPREIEDKHSYQWRVKNNTLYQIDSNGRDVSQGFTFDKVYDKDTKTTDVYNDIAKPIVEAATAGFNGTIFAYGQTSSGKTYTMSGTQDSVGIIQLAVLDLFRNIKNIPGRDFLVRVSYIEIYNETVKDLLDVTKQNLKIHDSYHGVKVDATEKVTTSAEEVFEVMTQGDSNRRVGATNMNEESSRSHSIFQITIESREHIEGEEQAGCVNVSQLNLVDLAGSERSGQTGATGVRFKEGTHINKSLSFLALVIKQLSEDPNKFINYRDSKLTRILQNSLGGNAKTSIICAVTPAAVDETISTLQFANRAKAIKNKPEVNAVATDATMIQSLTKQLSKLQSELANKKNLEQDNYNLMQQIARLQRYILNGIAVKGAGDGSSNRRKTWCAPRRMTISSVQSSGDVFVAPKPKFRTPVLKYNPLTTPMPVDFKPIQNDKLASVPEETVAGHVTPTQEKKVNFKDEVIELDSDEDVSVEEVTCSPYHKCYGSSKTPPCVLRKNAKQAERNLLDIVELTEREKIYKPEVVELMKKLDENTSVISRLEEQVSKLNSQCKEKDLEIEEIKNKKDLEVEELKNIIITTNKDKESQMEELLNKIRVTEEEMQKFKNEKCDLETLCNEYNTKLTDLEVSYDTIKKKAKSREDELLSLLSEQKSITKANDIHAGKTLSRTLDKELTQFMDMSKDISLVNSENESDNTNLINDESVVIEDLLGQLTSKNQIIDRLESQLAIQKEDIISMENSNLKFQAMLTTFEEKYLDAGNEISLMKSIIENLNTTVKSLQANLESANNDITTYNNFILDLKNQLIQKGDDKNANFDDTLLDSMVANENQLIANNENMDNIIKSFKIALHSHFTEIKNMKLKLNCGPVIDNNLVDIKENQIQLNNEEIENLNKNLKENIETIKNLTSDNSSLQAMKQQLSEEIEEKLKQNIELHERIEEQSKKIELLEEHNEKLSNELAEKEKLNLEISSKNENLTKELMNMSEKLMELQNNCPIDGSHTINKDMSKSDFLNKVKELVVVIQDISKTFSNDLKHDSTEDFNDFAAALTIISNNLVTLRSMSSNFMLEKRKTDESNTLVTEKLQSLQLQIDNLSVHKNELKQENESLLLEKIKLIEDLENVCNELGGKNKETIELQINLNNTNKKNECLCKDNALLTEKVHLLQLQIDNNLAYENELKLENESETLEKVKLIEDLENVSNELEVKIKETVELQMHLNNTKEKNEGLCKDNILLTEKIHSLQLQIDNHLAHENELKLESESLALAKSKLIEDLENIVNELNGKNKETIELQTSLNNTNEKYEYLCKDNGLLTEKVNSLQLQIDNHLAYENELKLENESLTLEKIKYINDLENVRNELDAKNKETIELQMNLNNAKEKNESLCKDNTLLTEKVHSLHLQVNNDLADENELKLGNESLALEKVKLVEDLENVRNDLDRKIKETIELQMNSNIINEKNESLCKDNAIFTEKVHSLQLQIDNHLAHVNELKLDNDSLTLEKVKLIEDLENVRNELDKKNKEITELHMNLNNTKDKNDNLCKDLILKENILLNLKEDQSLLNTQIKNITQESNERVYNLNKDIEELHSALKSKDQALLSMDQTLQIQKDEIVELKKGIEAKNIELLNYRNEVIPKLQESENFYEQLENSNTTLKETQCHLKNIIEMKDVQIAELKNREPLFEKQIHDVIKDKDTVLESVLDKILHLNGFTENELGNFKDANNTFEKIIYLLDKMSEHLMKVNIQTQKDKQEHSILVSKVDEDMRQLKNQNHELFNGITTIKTENKDLQSELEEIKSNNQVLKASLITTNVSLTESQKELQEKVLLLNDMETKIKHLKSQIIDFDNVIKEMQKIQEENDSLQIKLQELEKKTCDFNLNPTTLTTKLEYDYCNQKDFIEKSSAAVEQYESPKSLLTLCCNIIVENIKPEESDLKSVTTSSFETDLNFDSINSNSGYKCTIPANETQILQTENLKLKERLIQVESVNKNLLEDQEEIRKEVKLLLEYVSELQKKINNHKTHLHTLTATTYTENKLLNSKVKVLQHHNDRVHNVSQKDIPAIKNQLVELLTIIRSEASLMNQQNNVKRFSLPDVLDKTSTFSNFRNESILDADLLMLDTNITLTTANSTLIGHDQTCLDINNIEMDNVACQTSDMNEVSKLEIMLNTNNTISAELQILNKENVKLREQIENLKLALFNNQDTDIKLGDKTHILGSPINVVTKMNITSSPIIMIDAASSPVKNMDKVHIASSPIKINRKIDVGNSPIRITSGTEDNPLTSLNVCENCKNLQENLEEVKALLQKLKDIQAQKEVIEEKYNNLTLEIPATENLVRKLSALQRDYNGKIQEVEKLTNDLQHKNKLFQQLQEENDSLSTQVMETISECDDLRKELDSLKESNNRLSNKVKSKSMEHSSSNMFCSKCMLKEEILDSVKSKTDSHSKLNRSHSDSDSSSRYNKISTLQNELHAGREDCKKLSEEVATIKNHLERSNLSIAMDLDESGENIFTFTKDFDNVSLHFKDYTVDKIPEEQPSDIYALDKIECLNYYIEKTGSQKENLDRDDRIISVMKMLYENLISKNGNEVENLRNNLRDAEESKHELQKHIDDVSLKYSKITKELEMRNVSLEKVTETLSKIKTNLNIMNMQSTTSDNSAKLITDFKENVLDILDNEFQIPVVSIFESLIHNVVKKNENDLNETMDRYSKLQQHTDSIMLELGTVNDSLSKIKSQMADKENEYNLLKAQKEKISEISNAVTLDLIMKERELNEIVAKTCQRLTDLNIIDCRDINITLPPNKNLDILLEQLIDNIKEKEHLVSENSKLKTIIQEKQTKLEVLKEQRNKIEEISRSAAIAFTTKDNELQSQISLYEDLKKIYDKKVEENHTNISIIEKITQETNLLKEIIENKESTIQSLETELKSQNNNISEKEITLLERIKELQFQSDRLKSVNQMITEQKEILETELQKSHETIKENNLELDKMTYEISKFQESIKDNMSMIETLKLEAKSLSGENSEIKMQLEDKIRDFSRLERNIKTYEKTAQIQSGMISRLQKQKEEDSKSLTEKNKQIEEIQHQCLALQKENETVKDDLEALKTEISNLKNLKEDLESRVSELKSEIETKKPRSSLDAASTARRRRQSLYDSKRTFTEDKNPDEINKGEVIFSSRSKPDDLFMDVDDDSSSRSTPCRLSKGRDSLPSRLEQSDREEEQGSRPGSVVATRRRRQSTHDLHRSALRTPDLPELSPSKLKEETKDVKLDNSTRNSDGEVAHLKERLASCMTELEELKERFREVDEECEICSQYLQERDEQCAKLRKEKAVLEKQVTELTEKLQNNSRLNQADPDKKMADVAVNTDADWAYLHSVVVDRMSFDAEVDKNKKLTKAIEEFRIKNRDLKATVAKLHSSLEKKDNNPKRELESMKKEIRAYQLELEELRKKCSELDEECEICGQYLKEKDEQIHRLKEAKAVLEAKLQTYNEDSGTGQTARRKRQSAHDQLRDSGVRLANASTNTSQDLLSYQVERDDSSRRTPTDEAKSLELQRLKKALKQLGEQKAALEQQIATSAPPTLYVSTGSAIVQSQQLTDVMKENDKLKKINAKLVNLCKKRGNSLAENKSKNDTELG